MTDNVLVPTLKYQCPRCVADPHPTGFGSPRNCAFDAEGQFTADNWNCATVCELFRAAGDRLVDIEGNNETMQVIPALSTDLEDGEGGWLVFTRHKRRGRDSSAVHVGDFWPPKRVTLGKVDAAIQMLIADAQEAG